jgi:transposase
MDATTVAVDLAKTVFQLAEADGNWHIVRTHRLTRSQFERFFVNRDVHLVVMEACGSGHYWARRLGAMGLVVRLLPPRQVRPYVLGNKTDAADCAALLEAARNCKLKPVRVKSEQQQALQALHRLRTQWMRTRTQRINALRGVLREFGMNAPVGARRGLAVIAELVAGEGVPALVRETLQIVLEEIRALEGRIAQLERQLAQIARSVSACRLLMTIPGVGLLTATALVAAVGSDVAHFKSARHFASWFGLVPREHSSGSQRKLGRITKRGDCYLRTLFTHGARSVLLSAARVRASQRECHRLQAWALDVQQRTNPNKATCALANKLARICFATLRAGQPFDRARATEPL